MIGFTCVSKAAAIGVRRGINLIARALNCFLREFPLRRRVRYGGGRGLMVGSLNDPGVVYSSPVAPVFFFSSCSYCRLHRRDKAQSFRGSRITIAIVIGVLLCCLIAFFSLMASSIPLPPFKTVELANQVSRLVLRRVNPQSGEESIDFKEDDIWSSSAISSDKSKSEDKSDVGTSNSSRTEGRIDTSDSSRTEGSNDTSDSSRTKGSIDTSDSSRTEGSIDTSDSSQTEESIDIRFKSNGRRRHTLIQVFIFFIKNVEKAGRILDY
ncbi:hypothetical protein F3Y22_tig00117056pilonHSYRG01414 [Hibiscus syriacus]|uniref:Uncharacterized protein n=1 Tax=Hibiscus syriacus TaxID=106335 RepID=A0A6A2XCC8_HIBSY|nr:hypothetical protein F3Y22_tig00117056pilonHSYRG01414 [Hibiscus syriacus]